MKPLNEKSLFHALCDAMDKVVSGEISAEQAKAISSLSCECEKLLKGERQRVRLLMDMEAHEKEFGSCPKLRELAAIGFADTTIDQQTGLPRNDNAEYCK